MQEVLQNRSFVHALPRPDRLLSKFTERIFSTVQTCKMQARVAYEFVHEAVQSWVGHLHPPSLVPEHIHLQHRA